MLPSHVGDGTTTHSCTGYGKVTQPCDRSIEVLSYHEEVRYMC
jgi:hypothetical protein